MVQARHEGEQKQANDCAEGRQENGQLEKDRHGRLEGEVGFSLHDEGIVDGRGVVDQNERRGQTGDAADQREEGNPGALEAHGGVHSMDGEGRIDVPLPEAGVADLFGGVHEGGSGGEFRTETMKSGGRRAHAWALAGLEWEAWP